eukprot:CAMPEP_0181167966 /NCGR_PEP_ID=MMETSP1096-20121128/6_1 /TAXON_ID=156174 ORGANISM="Chrysochromulina ericina, Strain CCMP281" /NCGR_SAMPLE_ID=MMETSP1096 /ASSEMBLY_ACC=CAM_ASM_000453 /LENGTH=64 /DNA_ID=CAMNT_0023255279 /DNA_START=197 /DNA_END=392 /DNA_ORIENTATION=-
MIVTLKSVIPGEAWGRITWCDGSLFEADVGKSPVGKRTTSLVMVSTPVAADVLAALQKRVGQTL